MAIWPDSVEEHELLGYVSPHYVELRMASQ